MITRRCSRCGKDETETQFKSYHAWCVPCQKEYDAIRRQTPQHRARQFAYDLMRKYGLSVDDYWKMFEEQGGVCIVCKRPETKVVKGVLRRLPVDHDHVTGANRGLLCDQCNTAIGKMQDSPELLRAAAEYIEHHRSKAQVL